MPDMPAPSGSVPVTAFRGFVASLFAAAGLGAAAARRMADGLVEADQQGLGSHGVSQAQMYLQRMRAGSVTNAETASVAHDNGAVAVLDAAHMLGHLAADQAMALAIAKAKQFGLGAVALRHGFHFGVSGQYALQAARAGCVGIVMCNTKPAMPAPGGGKPLVGTNPLAIAVPTGAEPVFLLDMATSEGALGKIRGAARRGEPIPPTWAVTADGKPTTDPNEAIKGMLLPSGGPKGFALAFMIDMACALLAGGAWGDGVKPLYGDLSLPNDNSALFIALDVSHFRSLADFQAEAERARTAVLESPVNAGARVMTPGQPAWERQQQQQQNVTVDSEVLAGLNRLAAEFGVAPFST